VAFVQSEEQAKFYVPIELFGGLMKLFFSPGACSLAPHIVLQEAGVRYSTEQVDLKEKKYKGGDYLQVNKKGSVPCLEIDNGERLTEAAVISQYIADQNPTSNLLPAPGSWERYRAQEWMNYVATELHKGFGSLFNPAMPEEAKKIAIGNLEKRFAFVNDHLAKNQYLMGDKFTATDAYLFTVMNWAKKFKLDLSKWPNLSAFMDRMAARPAVQTVMKQEGLI
jgi:glutathione S-transferase